jgi:hypothetical protein
MEALHHKVTVTESDIEDLALQGRTLAAAAAGAGEARLHLATAVAAAKVEVDRRMREVDAVTAAAAEAAARRKELQAELERCTLEAEGLAHAPQTTQEVLAYPTPIGRTVNGAEMTLQQAREKGLAKSRGDVLVLPLTDASKGRVALGEVSVLFQFVTPPPEPKREELPVTIKGNFLSQIDQFFFLILAASVFVHFSGATFIACQPIPEEKELSLDELPDRFVKAMMPVEVKKPEPKPEVAKGDDKKEEKKEDKVAEADKKEKAATSNEKKAELQAKVAQLLREFEARRLAPPAATDAP